MFTNDIVIDLSLTLSHSNYVPTCSYSITHNHLIHYSDVLHMCSVYMKSLVYNRVKHGCLHIINIFLTQRHVCVQLVMKEISLTLSLPVKELE